MKLKLHLLNQVSENTYDCVIDDYRLTLFLDIENKKISIKIKQVEKSVILIKKSDDNTDNELKRREEMVGKTISFCCDNNTYTPMMNRLLKEYRTSLDDLEYETQT